MEGAAPMSRTLARWTALSFTAALLIAANAFSQDREQTKKNARRTERDRVTPVASDHERASGVIVKAEAIGKGARSRSDNVEREKGQAPTQRLTINTAAVWRDWVRDQAGVDADASPREAAKSGANSVATKGEPQSEDTLIVVDIGPQTKIETRFRESTDETGKGAKTPEEALASSKEDPVAEKAKGDTPKRREKRAERSKIAQYEADDLQTGLFVEVDYRHQDARNVAAVVAVLRPVGGPDSPGEPVKGEGKARIKAKAKAKGKARAKD
jgi:hypothetical protein